MRNAHGADLAVANLTSASLLNAEVSHVTSDKKTMPNASRKTSPQYLQTWFTYYTGATGQALRYSTPTGHYEVLSDVSS